MNNRFLWKEIRDDIRSWPGGRSIYESCESDLYEPTTLAVVSHAFKLNQHPKAAALLSLAETAGWSRKAADELLDIILERIVDQAYEKAICEFAPK